MIHNLRIMTRKEENEEEIETSTFMTVKHSQPLAETKLEQSLECNVQGKSLDTESVSFNEFPRQCLRVLTFPSLLPYGKGDRTSNETIRDKTSK